MKVTFFSKYNSAKFAGYLAIGGNSLLFVLKIWAGIITGSVALVADAWHTLSDSLSSLILLIGLYFSSKPADKDHPFGHGRAEIIASLAIGFILVLIALNFLYESITRILERQITDYGLFAIIATSISLISKEIMARVSFSAAKIEKLKSLRADGWHHRSDALTSAVILIGIFLGNHIWFIDGALGIFVSVMIMVLAYRIVIESINPLLGEKADEDLIGKINNISKEIYQGDLFLHHFHLHRYGNHTEITFHIKLPGNYNLEDANKITSVFIKKIKTDLNIFATIYIDAYTKMEKN
jgi:cation diffusion facilitator family transporter